jgi:hypothetical protein
LLYSVEFYEVIKKHLRKGGILQMWYPAGEGDDATAAAVAKAIQQSFPYVRAFMSFDRFGFHFLASMQPLPETPSSVLASRMPSAAVPDFLEWGPESTVESQFERVVSQERTMQQIVDRDPKIQAIRDDEPVNEYYLLRGWFHLDR